MKVSRRTFIQTGTSATAAALVLGFRLPGVSAVSETDVFEPNAYIRITPDNVVTLWVTRSEMGQGVRTNLPAALAEELEVDLDKVKLEQAMPGARFNGIRLRTSGSGSSSGTFMALRRAGATARAMLIAAAAEIWKVDKSSCKAEAGYVIHVPSRRKLTYGDLVAAAAKQTPPANPPLKAAQDFRLIGKQLKRSDGALIVGGRAVYGIDVRVPNLLFAVMERSPYLGGKVASFDGSRALKIPGVRHVVAVDTGIFPGVAVVADNTWSAMKGREALDVRWTRDASSDFDSNRFIEQLKTASVEDGYPLRRAGDTPKAFAAAAKKIDAVYEYPFQAHAPLETMNTTAHVRADGCDVWTPTQTPETAHRDLQKMLGLGPDAVKIHTTLLGGGFGRRLIIDYVHEAVTLSKAIGKPVQLLWTRADDMHNGFFHPPAVERLNAAFAADGRLTAWLHKSAGPDLSLLGTPTPEERKDLQRYAKDESPWGAFDNPYSFPSMQVDYVLVDSPVPTGPWRAVYYPARVFARESFIDEIAHVMKKDPLQLRIDLLQPGDVLKLGTQQVNRARMIRVLEVAREKSGWTRPMVQKKSDRLYGRGIALNIYQGDSYIAQVAEVSVAKSLRDFRVEKIYCIVDCGFVINPAGLEGQVESGITWGLSAALHGKIAFRAGRAQQSTYQDFKVMRMDEMPEIETFIVPGDVDPAGFGEHPVPPVAPAVANALFAATGKRVRRLPITPESLGS